MIAYDEDLAAKRFREGRYDGVLEHLSSAPSAHGKYVMWDKGNEDEILNAKEAFEAHRAKGGTIHVSSKVATVDGTELESFDPQIEHMQAVPRIAGG